MTQKSLFFLHGETTRVKTDWQLSLLFKGRTKTGVCRPQAVLVPPPKHVAVRKSQWLTGLQIPDASVTPRRDSTLSNRLVGGTQVLHQQAVYQARLDRESWDELYLYHTNDSPNWGSPVLKRLFQSYSWNRLISLLPLYIPT